MSAPAIAFSGIRYRYAADRPLLAGVDLALEPGERAGLRGANGSGKTTLLLLGVGLLPAAGGEVRVDGRPCRSEADFQQARRRVGLLFQDPDDQLFCTTVEEDLAFGPFNLGWPRERVERQVAAVLERLRIGHLARRVTYQLSEGEKRMVALGTLLTMEPSVLLLDEPSEGLDDDARARLIELLLELPQAMLVASHDHDLLQRVCGRTLRLADGRVSPFAPGA